MWWFGLFLCCYGGQHLATTVPVLLNVVYLLGKILLSGRPVDCMQLFCVDVLIERTLSYLLFKLEDNRNEYDYGFLTFYKTAIGPFFVFQRNEEQTLIGTTSDCIIANLKWYNGKRNSTILGHTKLVCFQTPDKIR